MNKKAASQHACPFHNISQDSGGARSQNCTVHNHHGSARAGKFEPNTF
jgi:hypothetical protein